MKFFTPTVEDLKKLKRQAMHNANRQRKKVKYTKISVRVRPEFWEQVARDYQRQINNL